jgi:probable rRNA maturation factor
MEALVDTVIEDDRWIGAGLEALATRAVRAAFWVLGLPEAGLTLCVMGCDDGRIAALNAEFRGKPAPTNVLSWPAWDLSPEAPGGEPEPPEVGSADAPESLGDIALAYETCAREAAAAKKPLADHATHLIVHGLLHLLGHDHLHDPDAARMEALEVQILATLAIPDPYGDAEDDVGPESRADSGQRTDGQ